MRGKLLPYASVESGGKSPGCYMADPMVAWLASRTREQLDQIDSETLVVSAKRIGGAQGFEYQVSPAEAGSVHGSITNILKLDGSQVFDHHLQAILSTAPYVRDPKGFDYEGAIREATLPSSHQALAVAIASERDPLSGPLVLHFKNSPDDWFGLVSLMSDPRSREALRKGGIVTEGFNPGDVEDAIRRWLLGVGETQIPVVSGFAYSEAEVAPYFNFHGERVLNGAGAQVKAFRTLRQAPDRFPDVRSAFDLYSRAKAYAKKSQHRIQAMILGAGLDLYRAVEVDPELASHIRGVYVMGGGRPDGKGGVEVTRNWRLYQNEIYDGMERIGGAGAEVVVFSSNAFGNNVGVGLGSDGVALSGSMQNVYNYIRELAGDPKNDYLAAILAHWRLWAIAYEPQFRDSKVAYDPATWLDALKTSMLGVLMTRALIEGKVEMGPVKISVAKVDIRKKMAGEHASGNVHWLEQEKGAVDPGYLTDRLLASVHRLGISDSDVQTPWSQCEAELRDAVLKLRENLVQNSTR